MSISSIFHKKKTPTELIKETQKNVQLLDDKSDDKSFKKVTQKVSECLCMMKYMLYGDTEHQPKPENIDKLTQLLLEGTLLIDLLSHLRQLEFEAKKDLAQTYNFLLRRGNINKMTAFVEKHPFIIKTLVEGYDDPEIALNCGSILREVIRHQSLCQQLLESPLFDSFFAYVQKSNFDVASDAFATFKLMLTKHKELAFKFLMDNYDRVISQYNKLVQSNNYVTKRQSLKLLGEIILDRTNFKIMMKYINDPENLKIMMNLLRGPSKTIQFEAFHVFKVFVANPNKSKPIVDILLRNRDRLIEFLQKFRTDKDTDQFTQEKQILLTTLQKMQPISETEGAKPDTGKEKPDTGKESSSN